MINRCLVALLCLVSASSSLAQLRVELEFEQETYLPREPMYAVVRVYNTSGRTLTLGRDNEWLSFTVENVNNSIVKQRKPADVEGEFSLPSTFDAKKRVDLAEAYDLSKYGRYIIRANVKIAEWQETYASKAVPVGIATGVKLWETTFGLPEENRGGAPELRKFQLLSANHLKRLSLYVRVTGENEGETFNLFPLGTLHGFSRPEPQMDRWSNLHVMYQDGAKSFSYNMITPDGLLLARQTWELTDVSRPGMKLDDSGHIAVSGGVRRVKASDLPPPDLLAENTEPPAESAPAEPPLDGKTTEK